MLFYNHLKNPPLKDFASFQFNPYISLATVSGCPKQTVERQASHLAHMAREEGPWGYPLAVRASLAEEATPKLWLFLVAPIVGGLLDAAIYRFIGSSENLFAYQWRAENIRVNPECERFE
jgi:hypothetical protein